MRVPVGFCVALGVLLGTAGLVLAAGSNRKTYPQSAKATSQTATHGAVVLAEFAKLPLAFEPNRGQTDSRIKFLSRGPGYKLFLGPNLAVFKLPVASERATETAPPAGRYAVLELKLEGANPSAKMTALNLLPGRSNYFIGNDPSKWLRDIPIYRQVRVEEIYPGISLTYYGTPSRPGQLEYDFTLSPGAEPQAISLGIETDQSAIGNRKSGIRLDRHGDLVIATPGGKVRFNRPVIYQPRRWTIGSGNSEFTIQNSEFVAGRYVLTAGNRIRFEIPSYDKTRPLIIDPVLSYSTFLGGSGIDVANGIAVGVDGTAFVAGGTSSTDFPVVHALQPNAGGPTDFPQDAFVSKLSADGSTLLYSTYLGGENQDAANGIAVDSFGNAYVTGTTISPHFPFSIGSFKPNCGCDGKCNTSIFSGLISSDGFVVKLNPAGSAIDYSGAISGLGNTQGLGIAVDNNGSAYATGTTDAIACSDNLFPFPWPTNGFQPSLAGSADGFIVKIDPTGSSVLYASYLGGTGEDDGFGIAADNSNNAFVTGMTCSGDFPVLHSLLLYRGNCDAFVTKANTLATGAGSLVYSTYLGGAAKDQGNAISLDAGHTGSVVYVTGSTNSTNFPTTTGVLQSSCARDALGICEGDAFITSLTGATAPAVAYSTYLGGTGADSGAGIAVDTSGNAYITGITNSTNFPTGAAPFQANYGGGNSDAFVAKLNPGATALVYSSFLGGSNADNGTAIALDAFANAYVTGQTCSTDFPTHLPEQPSPGGNCDAFVSKVLVGPDVTILPTSLAFSVKAVGATSAPQTVTVTSNGDSPLVLGTISISGEFVQTNSCSGATLPPGQTCTISVEFAPTSPGPQKGTLTVPDNVVGSPQTVALTGEITSQGGGFAMTIAPPSATIFAGQSAAFVLTVAPLAGFKGTVNLACSGLPRDASCVFSAGSVTLDGVNSANINLTVTTTARVAAPPRDAPRSAPPFLPGRALPFGLAGLLLAAAAAWKSGRRRVSVVLAMALLTALSWAACSGGTPVGVPTGTPAGTYTIQISGSSGTVTNSTSATLTVN